MPPLTICLSCAERLEPEDKFCGNCGVSLAAAPDAPPHSDLSGEAPDSRGTRLTGPSQPGLNTTKTPGALPTLELGRHTPAADETYGHGDYGLAPPLVDDDYGLAPPTRTTVPPSFLPPPRAGIADPRESLLAPEPKAQAQPEAEGVCEPQPVPEAAEASQPLSPCVACGISAVVGDGYCEHCGHAQPHRRDHIEQALTRVSAVTDRGLRHHRNEDAFAVSETTLPDGSPAAIAVVCDGVSSSSRPDEASQAASVAASNALLTALSSGTKARQAMRQALLAASESVNSLIDGDLSDPETNAPACTFVSAVTTGELLTVGWVGDSRAYWIPDDRTADNPARLTEDDSWAARMVEAGLLCEEEAYADERAHAITGWLGADAVELDPHTASFEPDRPGVVVICTDGLWNYAESATELAAVMPSDARTCPLQCARTLVGVALDGGGHDNITVAVIPFPGPA